jgi:alpha-glucosidase
VRAILKEQLSSDPNWWKKAVFYQIYPRSFKDSNGDGIGDLPGIIEKLDYLNGTPDSLGIDAIWFNPFFVSPDKDHGYDVADYCDIDPRFGTLEDFDRLVEECHKRGIRVMLDLVVNHTSDRHPWFQQSRSSRDNPYRDWYIWRDGRDGGKRPPNNWKSHFSGPAWTWDEKTGQYYLHSFLKEQPDLNWFNPEVRKAIYQVVRFWLERGADGFRLDVAHAYCKDQQFRDNPPYHQRLKLKGTVPLRERSLEMVMLNILGAPKYHLPETHQILREIRNILNEYPAKTSIGEIQCDDPAVVASYYGQNNDELHMNFYFDLTNCHKWKAAAFRRYVDRWEKILPEWAWPAYTFSNHDVVRAISRFGKGEQADRRARLLALMLLTLRCTPFIYYGEEIGMKFLSLPKKLRQDPVGLRWYPFHPGRDGSRTPMQWNRSRNAGFSPGEPWLPLGPEWEKRNVEVQEQDPASLLNFYKSAIRLRKSSPALQEGSYRSVAEGMPESCYVYLREGEDQKMIVALNFGSGSVKLDLSPWPGAKQLLLSTDHRRGEETLKGTLELGPEEGCVLQLER